MTREDEDRIAYERAIHNTTWQSPTCDKTVRSHQILRDAAVTFMASIIDAAPASRERSLALTHAETAMLWANEAISRSAIEGTK